MSNSELKQTVSVETPIYVVCDANGVCYGIRLSEEEANQLADRAGAYVSSHRLDGNVTED